MLSSRPGLTARTVAQKLSESMGQPVVVDNRAGANGILGTSVVAKAAPDGYTILLTDRGALGINPSTYKKLAYAGAGLDAPGSSSEEMADTVKRDVARFGAQVKTLGIEPE